MSFWSEFKTALSAKVVSLQFEDAPEYYAIFAIDGPVKYDTQIFKGAIPGGWEEGGYSQAQNDLDLADWETNYKLYANRSIVFGGQFDPRNLRRFGNLTAAGTPEVVVSARPYNSQTVNAQRSLKSTSAADSFALGTGAQVVRLVYLTSDYVLKSEDIQLNGITPVLTVATDICFVESLRLIKGTFTVGAVELFVNLLGTGTAICGIGAVANTTFLCHHYVPTGMRAWLSGWSVEATHSAVFGVKAKLITQERIGTNIVDVHQDLVDGNAIAANGRLTFRSDFAAPILVGEKTYMRPTVVPSVAGIIIRAAMTFVEDKAIQ